MHNPIPMSDPIRGRILGSILVAMAMAAPTAGCRPEPPDLTGGDAEDTSSHGSSTGATLEPPEAETSLGSSTGSELDPEQAESSSGTAEGEGEGSLDPLPECGNGVAEGDEECDLEDLHGTNCSSLGFDGGVLGCHGDCTFATNACGACGNGVVEPWTEEECDGVQLGGEGGAAPLAHAAGPHGMGPSADIDTGFSGGVLI